MSVTARGVKNAFRNSIRSISITAILALTIALALVMLLSLKAVQARIDDVKASVGNTVTVLPAGARGFQGGGQSCKIAEGTTTMAIKKGGTTKGMELKLVKIANPGCP